MNELLVGDIYLKAHEKIENGMSGSSVLGFVNCLDDDISTTGTKETGNVARSAWSRVVTHIHGYYAWQQDVRYSYGKTNQIEDNATWNTLYERINRANNVIDVVEIVPRHTHNDTLLYHRVKGEAHFLRAQFYFTLANLYSPAYSLDSAQQALCVPLKLSPAIEHNKDKDTQFERATQAEVYSQIVKDLEVAVAELTKSPQPERFRLHRASAEAAGVLLSRVHLYMQNWEAAEKTAREVIQSPKVKLAGVSEIVQGQAFLTQGAKEVLFSQGSNYLAPTDENSMLSADPGDFCVSRDLYNTFGYGDVRARAFFAPRSGTDSIALLSKYQRGIQYNHISDALSLRSSEAYLNLAEALVMQKTKDTEALEVINDFRRHRFEEYQDTAAVGADLAKIIREERRRELCFEGHRWFDLRRYAVNKVYPYSKDIVHAYNAYTVNSSFITTHYYRLPAGDPAYTFAIPSKVVDFDKKAMPNNPRPERKEVRIIQEADSLTEIDFDLDNGTMP